MPKRPGGAPVSLGTPVVTGADGEEALATFTKRFCQLGSCLEFPVRDRQCHGFKAYEEMECEGLCQRPLRNVQIRYTKSGHCRMLSSGRP